MSTAAILRQIAEHLAPTEDSRRSLPPGAYIDPGVFALEIERIFLRSWLCVGREADFPRAGDYRALTLAGEPIIVVRGGDGQLRALSNACRHRLYPLLPEGAGSAGRLTCAFHKWTYALDGRLIGAPYMEATPAFSREGCALPRFRVETWLGFIFVNLDATAPPLAPNLAPIEEALGRYETAQAVEVAHYRKTWQGNWKLAVENASESYHHMGLHARSVEANLPTAGTRLIATSDDWAWHDTPLRPEVIDTYLRLGDFPNALTEEDRAVMKVFTVYPGFVLLTVGDLIQALSFLPLDVDRTDVEVMSFVPRAALALQSDPEAFKEAMRVGQDAVNEEDEAATALVQANAASRFAARGWLSDKEPVLPKFHAYLARALLVPAQDSPESLAGAARHAPPEMGPS